MQNHTPDPAPVSGEDDRATDFLNLHEIIAKARQNRREISRALEHWTRRGAHRDAKLLANHIRERRLAETRRTVQQHVIERFVSLFRRRDRHLQVRANTFLTDVVVQRSRTETRFVLDVLVHARGGYDSWVSHSSVSRQSSVSSRQSGQSPVSII